MMKSQRPLLTVSAFAALISFAAAASVGKSADSEAEQPKITHENLYQMEELVKQGADPNVHYRLYPGQP